MFRNQACIQQVLKTGFYMNKKDLILNILLFISQIIVFYYFFCYLFPFKEQLQMFQFTSQYLTETLKQAGGVAIYISEFLSQFYVVFWTGPIISALLLTLVALLSSLILKKINSRNDLPLIFLLPWLSLLVQTMIIMNKELLLIYFYCFFYGYIQT